MTEETQQYRYASYQAGNEELLHTLPKIKITFFYIWKLFIYFFFLYHGILLNCVWSASDFSWFSFRDRQIDITHSTAGDSSCCPLFSVWWSIPLPAAAPAPAAAGIRSRIRSRSFRRGIGPGSASFACEFALPSRWRKVFCRGCKHRASFEELVCLRS